MIEEECLIVPLPDEKPYYCAICGEWFDGEPHTDPATGEDCHAECCPVCRKKKKKREEHK